jgi:hypothetical protein
MAASATSARLDCELDDCSLCNVGGRQRRATVQESAANRTDCILAAKLQSSSIQLLSVDSSAMVALPRNE